MIKSLLQVDPKNRATTKQIIHMPVFIARYNEIREEKARDYDQDEVFSLDAPDDLLGTIKVPRNLKLLSERLPKSNYGNKKSEATTSSDESSDQSQAAGFRQINNLGKDKVQHLHVIHEEQQAPQSSEVS